MTSPASNEVTQILSRLNEGDSTAGRQLLPIVYDELRRVAQAKMRHEPAGMTLQATALVHEAYMRLVGDADARWENRAHFFGSAAEAMRRILVDRARRVRRFKHGGDRQREPLDHVDIVTMAEGPDEDILLLDEALTTLESEDPDRAQVVKLRYFAGLTIEQTAELMNISPKTVTRHWTCARAWLHHRITEGGAESAES